MADTINVPDEQPTIQEAINVSSDDDSILVSPGFCPESINFEGKAILVSSLYLIENDSLLIGATIIDAQENGSGVTFSNSETDQSILQGFTIQNGTGNDEDPDDNGSFYTYGASGTIENHDAMCVLPINIVNEKIYVFMWFWLLFLCCVSLIDMVYQIFIVFNPIAVKYHLRLRLRKETNSRYLFIDLELVDNLVEIA